MTPFYTFYSESHTRLINDFFLPSFERHSDGYNLIVDRAPQLCSGNFRTDTWQKLGIWKNEWFVRKAKANIGKVFVMSDCDVQFFQSTRDRLIALLSDYDICFQANDPYGGICSGFFVARGSDRLVKFLEWPLQNGYYPRHKMMDDQAGLRAAIKHVDVRIGLLPECEFWTTGLWRTKHWKGEHPNVPPGIRMHHANWCYGVPNKCRLLEAVRKVVTERGAA